MESTKGQQTTNLLYAINGAEFSYDDWHKGITLVERYGLTRPIFTFLHNDAEIAHLEWRRARSGIYRARDVEFELSVELLARQIKAVDSLSRISLMKIHRVPVNHKKPKLAITLSDADKFNVYEKLSSSGHLLKVTKEHYVNSLMTFTFVDKKVSKTIAKVEVHQLMRWEARHFHALLSLVMSWIAFSHDHRIYGVHRSEFTHGRPPIGRW
ncbi:MAG: hypothetical protein RMM17_05610 [Acidobacteriota bacterium]|nr:hypothetical protein [Blastocatellia bacterium]MDW8412142.1 hypothetical protein [Acidobacteriota bacterium]